MNGRYKTFGEAAKVQSRELQKRGVFKAPICVGDDGLYYVRCEQHGTTGSSIYNA